MAVELKTHHIGYGLMGLGGAVMGSSMIPEGSELGGAMPPGVGSVARGAVGMGLFGLGAAFTLVGSGSEK